MMLRNGAGTNAIDFHPIVAPLGLSAYGYGVPRFSTAVGSR
jgi:hypothetical protein